MMQDTPRLRMFAGPNGSGKSTIKTLLPAKLLGAYINPDDIQKTIEQANAFDLGSFGIEASTSELVSFLQSSVLLQRVSAVSEVGSIRIEASLIIVPKGACNSYLASVLADFIRRKLLAAKRSFTFETVMSSPDKVTLLKSAQNLGYRTYLYYIATEDPAINISRIRQRVAAGGHDVPKDKIISRYQRSLDLLSQAIAYSNRAYVFDNSTSRSIWIAEITDGSTLHLKVNQVPIWFKENVLERHQA